MKLIEASIKNTQQEQIIWYHQLKINKIPWLLQHDSLLPSIFYSRNNSGFIFFPRTFGE
jgi:hypothetical protein